MPLIFRAMLRDDRDGKPILGAEAKKLGVRFPPDPHPDIRIETDGTVEPMKGGMSVAPRWRDLPGHRVPKRLKSVFPAATGSNSLHLWKMGDGGFLVGPVAAGLSLRPDPKKPATHGFVEPSYKMPASDYQSAIAATRDSWQIDES